MRASNGCTQNARRRRTRGCQGAGCPAELGPRCLAPDSGVCPEAARLLVLGHPRRCEPSEDAQCVRMIPCRGPNHETRPRMRWREICSRRPVKLNLLRISPGGTTSLAGTEDHHVSRRVTKDDNAEPSIPVWGMEVTRQWSRRRFAGGRDRKPKRCAGAPCSLPEDGVRGSEKGVTGAGSQCGSLVERRTVANVSGYCCGGR